MEFFKKQWKNIIIILLVLFVGFNTIKNYDFGSNKNEDISILENYKKAVESYNSLLNEKREKLEKDIETLEQLESVNTQKIEAQKKETVVLKTNRDELKKKYQVRSDYDTTKLDELLRKYTNSKSK